MTQKQPEQVSDEVYETQSTLKYKKGTTVRVTRLYEEFDDDLLKFYNENFNSEDQNWREAAQTCLKERELLRCAIGRIFVVEDYTIGANPHIINVDGMPIGFPIDCLEEVN